MTDQQNQPSAADVAREIRAQEAAEKKQKEANDKKKAGQGCLILIGLIVIVGIIIGVSTSGGSGSSSSTAEAITLPNGDTVESTLATVLCRDHVRDQLLSPASAEFPGPFSSNYREPTRAGNTWNQVITVDSQNAFGAMIPSTWDCVVNGDTGTISATQRQ